MDLQIDPGGSKVSADLLENFDIENAIKVVREHGDNLIEATATAKHSFRAEWVDQLVAKFRDKPGKPVVHLSDLRDSVMPILTDKARTLLLESVASLFRTKGIIGVKNAFGNIAAFAREESNKPAKLRTWKCFSGLTGFDVNLLEPYVSALRLSGGRKMRTVMRPNLPMNLASPAGAKLIGYRLDSNYNNSAFTNKETLLHEDYRKAVTKVVGDIPFTETRTGNGSKPDVYLRTNVGNLVSTLMSVAGFDNTRNQRSANNPAPLWLFICPNLVITAFLAALWDAEGSSNKRDVRLRQAVEMLNLDSRLAIPYWPDSLHLGEFDQQTLNQVIDQPPRILTSTALLLAGLGIACHVMPERLSNTRNGVSAYWHLRIMRNTSVRAFYEQVKLLSPGKQKNLERSVASMRWEWTSTTSFPRKAS